MTLVDRLRRLPRPGRYAVAAAAALLLVVGIGWATSPRTQGATAVWEARALDGAVLGGRALVADDTNTALDLVGGKTITIGSVTRAERYVAGGRLLMVHGTTVDAAALDAQQRWTWTAPPGTTAVALVASDSKGLVARTCTEAEDCQLVGIGPTGSTRWTMSDPTESGGGEHARAPWGGLPTYAVLGAGPRTWLLVDPSTSRTMLRVADDVDVAPDGAVTLQERLDSNRCALTTGPGLDDLGVVTQSCGRPPSHDRGADVRLRDGESLTTSSTRPWWWPFTVQHRIDLSGNRRVTVVSHSPLTLLRLDAEGLTVREGDRVVRYRPSP